MHIRLEPPEVSSGTGFAFDTADRCFHLADSCTWPCCWQISACVVAGVVGVVPVESAIRVVLGAVGCVFPFPFAATETVDSADVAADTAFVVATSRAAFANSSGLAAAGTVVVGTILGCARGTES